MGDIWLPFDSYVSSPAKLALGEKKEGSSCGETPSGHIASFASVRVPSPAPYPTPHIILASRSLDQERVLKEAHSIVESLKRIEQITSKVTAQA